jgi:predicted ATPase with chaperone activity
MILANELFLHVSFFGKLSMNPCPCGFTVIHLSLVCVRPLSLRLQAVRSIQLACFSKIEASNIVANVDMRVGEIRQFCQLQDEGGMLSLSKCQSLMRAAMSQRNLSTRTYHRILNLVRTIADLAGSENIQSAHLAEALQYRLNLVIE